MNQLASIGENNDEDVLFMFEQDNTSHCLDLELQRLGEETAQMGLLVNNIEKRTKEDILRWQRVLEDSSLEGRASFLQHISHRMSPGSGSSPAEFTDENIIQTGLNKVAEQDSELVQLPRHRKRQGWKNWFKCWFHRHGNKKERENSDSDGLLVMNPGNAPSDRDDNDEDARIPSRSHSTVRARNFSDHALDSLSSMTLAERKYYFFGDNNRASLTENVLPSYPRSASESIISESTPSQHIAQTISMKYSALTHDPMLTAALHQNDGYLKSSSEITTPALLKSPQPKKSKSTSNLSSFRVRCNLRKRQSRDFHR